MGIVVQLVEDNAGGLHLYRPDVDKSACWVDGARGSLGHLESSFRADAESVELWWSDWSEKIVGIADGDVIAEIGSNGGMWITTDLTIGLAGVEYLGEDLEEYLGEDLS